MCCIPRCIGRCVQQVDDHAAALPLLRSAVRRNSLQRTKHSEVHSRERSACHICRPAGAYAYYSLCVIHPYGMSATRWIIYCTVQFSTVRSTCICINVSYYLYEYAYENENVNGMEWNGMERECECE